jgi:hypothetical protein
MIEAEGFQTTKSPKNAVETQYGSSGNPSNDPSARFIDEVHNMVGSSVRRACEPQVSDLFFNTRSIYGKGN